jgi:molybdenum cofactor biosynthesis protein MoaC
MIDETTSLLFDPNLFIPSHPKAMKVLGLTADISLDEQASSKRAMSYRARQQRAQSFQLMARSRIPLHLLPPSHYNLSHVRYSSSDSNASDKGDQPSSSTEDRSTQDEEVPATGGSFFGFQSLSGLFAPPEPRRRYSRPHEFQADSNRSQPATTKPAETDHAGKGVDVAAFTPSFISRQDRAQAVWTNPETSDTRNSTSANQGPNTDMMTSNAASIQPNTLGSSSTIVQRVASFSRQGRSKNRSYTSPDRTYTSPFRGRLSERLALDHTVRLVNPPPSFGQKIAQRTPVSNVKPTQPHRPWGLHNTPNSESPGGRHANVEPTINNEENNQDSTVVKSPAEASDQPRLTHLKSSGTAHMVDVGEKASTKRIAIATATVGFSNTEPYRLISENSNKKGDVLAVARVAAIMATKRTSDLVPLCHPIAISKVDVDVDLKGSTNVNPHGCIQIRVQVECVGPTGVEMEALTAASAAALTVHDMCKAVDREMTITSLRVPYKSGGKSGLHFNELWAGRQGLEFFLTRKLEIPPGWEEMHAMGKNGKTRLRVRRCLPRKANAKK